MAGHRMRAAALTGSVVIAAASSAQPGKEAEGGDVARERESERSVWSALADPLGPHDAVAIEPALDLTFVESMRIGSVLFPPEGDRALVQLQPDVVEVWPLAVHYAPEVLGGVSVLVLIPLIWVLLRIWRRPRRVGAPYCRKCNYDLSAHVPSVGGSTGKAPLPAKCPECGASLGERRPIRGRTRWRRAALCAAAAGAIVVGYTIVLVVVPRDGWASRLASIPSERLHALAEEKGLAWLKPFYSRRERWVGIDLLTGERTRQLPMRESITWVETQISPDGRLTALWGRNGEVECVSVKNGLTLGVLEETARAGGGPSTQHIVGFSAESDALYVAYADVSAKTERLVRWDFRADTTELCVEAPLHVEDFGTPGRASPVVRRYRVLGGDGPARYLAVPEFLEAYRHTGYFLRLYDEAGQQVGEYPLTDASPMAEPHVTPDGARVFVSGSIEGVLGFDLEERKTLGRLTAGREFHAMDEMDLSADGRRLFVSCFPDVILVRDIDAKRWIGRLDYQDGYVAPELTMSPDGRWLAAVPFESKGGGGARGPYLHHLLIFDLEGLEED